ncbi:ParA family protein [Arcobacter sp. CECT 8985]|uniref:ParA family protein n=1 Tax=Arcobacter sp. CECT 8985 TaxID=1935424 RepID=UPI00100B1A3C|nr:ParA family protein [Arcobacter sp. CECT 8985]
MILTVAHTKGGVGKSTLAWNIANCFINDGQKVKIIDLDFQQTIFFINDIRYASGLDKKEVIQCETAAELISTFETYNNDEILIVDVGGFDNDINRTAISWSDQIIVPISNSLTEVLGFKTFEAILEEIGNPFVNVVLNNIHPLTKDFDVITRAIGESENISLLNSIIRNRKIYKETLGVGKSIFDTKNEVAKAEIKGLCDELRSNW